MAEKTDAVKAKFQMSIKLRIFLVIIAVAIVIIVSGNAVGTVFLTRSINSAIADNMLVAVDIADRYITNEIEVLKIKASDAAEEINQLYRAGENGDVLERVLMKYSVYSGLAVFNETGLLSSWGETLESSDGLIHEPFMRTALAGGQGISNTMYSSSGSVVICVSAPINDTLVLCALLPGTHFYELLEQLRFWQTGHLFINDENGNVVSNMRFVWIQQRYNFLDMPKKENIDNAIDYEGLAAMARRGIAGERGIARYSIDGVPRMTAFRPISSPDVGWFIAIVAPLVESSLKDVPYAIMMIAVITFILSVIAAIPTAGFLKRPFEEANRLRRMAEAVSESKSTFLANMSHEIRTPMNSIVGFSELAMDSEPSAKTRDYLSKIRMNAEWLLQIINDILDISKVESGKMELENIPFDMHELFSNCRTLMMPRAVEKGITLYFYVEPSIGKRPLGDPTKLRQVLINLLSNAIKFTNTGMVKLNAALKEMSGKSITMYFEVKDSGIGMTHDQMEKIFDPFTQAESGTTRKYGGTGLGLAITKDIVELMGGKLSVESTFGVGSKFSFELTFDTIDITDDEMFEKKIVLNEFEKPLFDGEVLLCEDNTMNQQVICEHLARVGLKTIVAENGKVGVDIVSGRMQKNEKMFDLIFMDMHMPVMDGLEASSKIHEINANVPIVAMTANIMTNEKEVYKEHGMLDCIGKPFTSQELWRCLMKYLTPVTLNVGQKNMILEADLEFQKSLQLYFVKSNQNRYEDIVKAIEAGDIKLAHRFAHTLKGNAGQLGKMLLQKAAADVERQLKDGKSQVSEEQLKTLKTELNAVLTELSYLLAEAENKRNENMMEPIDPQKAMELFEKLEPSLKSGNPDCLKYIDELRSIQGCGQLIRQMEDYEFESALKTLEKMKERMA
jgi:signal transduction histidine kinase/CheY-like chemotaxis protein